MPERFEIYIVYKRRYINTLPFLFFLKVSKCLDDVCRVTLIPKGFVSKQMEPDSRVVMRFPSFIHSGTI